MSNPVRHDHLKAFLQLMFETYNAKFDVTTVHRIAKYLFSHLWKERDLERGISAVIGYEVPLGLFVSIGADTPTMPRYHSEDFKVGECWWRFLTTQKTTHLSLFLENREVDRSLPGWQCLCPFRFVAVPCVEGTKGTQAQDTYVYLQGNKDKDRGFHNFVPIVDARKSYAYRSVIDGTLVMQVLVFMRDGTAERASRPIPNVAPLPSTQLPMLAVIASLAYLPSFRSTVAVVSRESYLTGVLHKFCHALSAGLSADCAELKHATGWSSEAPKNIDSLLVSFFAALPSSVRELVEVATWGDTQARPDREKIVITLRGTHSPEEPIAQCLGEGGSHRLYAVCATEKMDKAGRCTLFLNIDGHATWVRLDEERVCTSSTQEAVSLQSPNEHAIWMKSVGYAAVYISCEHSEQFLQENVFPTAELQCYSGPDDDIMLSVIHLEDMFIRSTRSPWECWNATWGRGRDITLPPMDPFSKFASHIASPSTTPSSLWLLSTMAQGGQQRIRSHMLSACDEELICCVFPSPSERTLVSVPHSPPRSTTPERMVMIREYHATQASFQSRMAVSVTLPVTAEGLAMASGVTDGAEWYLEDVFHGTLKHLPKHHPGQHHVAHWAIAVFQRPGEATGPYTNPEICSIAWNHKDKPELNQQLLLNYLTWKRE